MMYAMQHKVLRKKFFGVFKSVTKPTVIVDEEGVVRLQKKNGKVYGANGDNWESVLLQAVENMTEYNDGGKTMPNTYVIFGKRILDLSGLWMRHRSSLWRKWNWQLSGRTIRL